MCLIDQRFGRRDHARASYGTATNVPFNPRYHDRREAKEVRFDSGKMTLEMEKIVTWLIKMGVRVSGDHQSRPVISGHIYIEEKVRRHCLRGRLALSPRSDQLTN
jgi:hypothetical protein